MIKRLPRIKDIVVRTKVAKKLSKSIKQVYTVIDLFPNAWCSKKIKKSRVLRNKGCMSRVTAHGSKAFRVAFRSFNGNSDVI